MKKKNSILVFFGTLLLTVAFAVSPTAGLGAEKYVTWLGLVDLTGPVGSLDVPIHMAHDHYYRYLNERGGVEGVKIKPIFVDTRYDTSRGISAFKRYRKEHKLVQIYITGTSIVKLLYPYAEKDKLVFRIGGPGEFQARLGRTFMYSPPYQDMLAAGFNWMVEDWQKKGNSGKPVVGYMGWDSPFCKEHLLGGKEYAEKIGVKLLPAEFFPAASLKHDLWLNRLAASGANYIYVSGGDPEISNIVRDAYALGLTKNIQLISDAFGTSTENVQAHPKELEGEVIVSHVLRGVEALNHPFAKFWTRYSKDPPSLLWPYIQGLVMSLTFEEGLRIALRDVGYEKMDGEAMYQAMQKLAGMDVKGLSGRIDYSPTSRRLSREVKFYRVTGGKIVSISDWTVCPDAVSLHKWSF